MKKVTALLIAFLILLSSSMIGANAITVERDGTQYILRSHTPTTGDINVLMVRIGFADYDVDDENDPADSEETLLSYFDGSEDSINAFYETSSYGKLHLHCDKVYSYNAEYSRGSYDNSDYDIEDLITETLTALEDEIDFDKYDSDGDGYLDFVCFDFSGPKGAWGTTWWPHVNTFENYEIGEKQIYAYSLLKGNVKTFIHEFGHILGADDYYSYEDSSLKPFMTYDMMSDNTGDHNGFTKWSYGWLSDEDIAYVDRSSGETTVTLTPIETSDSGKKIAVVAPELDRSNGFIDEYFLVEYDSGAGNNASAFEEFSLDPGFRIFHVYAKCIFIDGDMYISYEKNNGFLRDNLIHNVKNEFGDPYMWGQEDVLYREGDSLTPVGAPNTGLSYENIYNGKYTGISFTDFVTGDKPSFRVSFSNDPAPEVEVKLTLDYEELKSDMAMEVTADAYITRRNYTSQQDAEIYSPYLLDSSGKKLPLNMNSTQDPYTYGLSYKEADPPIEPHTEYTLVIPEGCFKTGYYQDVPEFRQTVVTADFLALKVISSTPNTEMETRKSNLFAVTDQTYGIISFPTRDSSHFTFAEYNLNGEEISSLSFGAPEFEQTDLFFYGCSAKKLNDGNFALILNTADNTYFIKIDRHGNVLSDIYTVSDSLVSGYAYTLMGINYDLYKGGLCKRFINDDYDAAMLIIDFESEPRLTPDDANNYYFSIDSEIYATAKRYDGQYHVLLSDASDNQIADIGFNAGFLCAFEEDGHVTVLKDRYDRDLDESFIYADTYSKDGELISSRDITENAKEINYYGVFNRCTAAKDGYFLELDEEDNKTVILYDKDWKMLGSFEFDMNTMYTNVGNCGLTRKTQFDAAAGAIDIISRFNIGEFEIVLKRQLLGDVDGDDEVTIVDATFIQRKLASIPIPFEFNETVADTDGDNNVSIIDATYIQRWLVNLPSNDRIGQPIT